MRAQKRYSCPICSNKVYQDFGKWAAHMELMHKNIIPEGWSPARYLYYLQTGTREGRCVECKGPTQWNEITKKYARYCDNPKCKALYVARAKGRMKKIYGKEHILNDPDVQRRMLAARKTAGDYIFEDGGTVSYLCSYEEAFLEMLDSFGFPSSDIMGPSPNTYIYIYENPEDQEHEGECFYIPDFFIPSLNLEIEIKTQENKHPKIQRIDKVKEGQKDAMMKTQKDIHYIKLSDKNYIEFYQYLIELGERTMEKDRRRKPADGIAPTMEAYSLDLSNPIFSGAMEDHNRCEYLEDGREPVLKLLPGEKPYGLATLRKAMTEDIFLISDFHVTYADEPNKLRAVNIIKNVNDTVPETAHLLILGDLGGKRGQESSDDTKDFISKIKCKNKYLILGNHDKLSIQDYVKMGFKAVTDYFWWKNVLFSHIPLAVPEGFLNIHGHNHGTETYINDGVSADDHIDVYTDTFIPRTLRHIMSEDGSPSYYDGYGETTHVEIDWNAPDIPEKEKAEEQMSEVFPIFYEMEKDYQDYIAMEAKTPPMIRVRKSVYTKNAYPVFIILRHGGATPLSKAIKQVTGDEFTHVSIAFDYKLEYMWSFGSKDKIDIVKKWETDIGFLAVQGIHSDYYRFTKVKYAIYYMEVDRETYEAMMDRLKFFRERRYLLRYDWIGLITNWFNVPREENLRWVCSSFVAYMLGAAIPLQKHYSTYTPQEIFTITDNMVLLMKGDDLYHDYTPEKCRRIISQLRVVGKIPPVLTGRSVEEKTTIAEEGLLSGVFSSVGQDFTPLEDDISFWKNRLFGGDGFIGKKIVRDMPKVSKYVSFKKVIIDNKRGIISIQNINIRLLLSRIKETYGEKRLEYIFEIMYNAKDIERYKKRKRNRNTLRKTALESPLFFAMELNVLFMELYDVYKDRTYATIAKEIYQNTWLKECDDKIVLPIDTSNLSQLSKEYIPKPHQLEFIQKYPSLKAKLNLDGYFLAFDQGLGKTLTATALSLCLNADRIYIVCPNSLKEVWRHEIGDYIERYKRSIPSFNKEVVICKKDIPINKNEKYIITNIESIPEMYPHIMAGNNMLIVDEMHNFRNLDGKRSQELFELKNRLKSHNILLMSGTPLKAAPSELSPALKMIDPLFTDDAAAMYNRCFAFDTTMAMTIVRKRFGYIMYRKTKEILDLPMKVIEDLPLPLREPEKFFMTNIRDEVIKIFNDYYSEELRKNDDYREEFTNLVTHYSSSSKTDLNKYVNWIIKTANTERSMPLHEIDQNFVDTYLSTYVEPNMVRNSDFKRVKELERIFIRMERSCYSRAIGQIYPPRRTELYSKLYKENEEKFLEMIIQNTKKTVIFSQFLGVVHYISDQLTEAGIGNVKIVGNTNNRMDLIDQFKSDDNIEVLLATSQTLGTGVTLIEANQMFFFGPPWRSTDYDQCCDRIYRIGQTSDVAIFNIMLQTEEFNLSDKMNKILSWSGEMFGAAIDETELED